MTQTNPKTDETVKIILALLEQVNPLVYKPIEIANSKIGLIGVDFIDGFCTPGAGALAPPTIDDQVESMIDSFDELARRLPVPVLLLRDSHPPGTREGEYPRHCEDGSGEDQIVQRLSWLANESRTTVLAKNCNSGVIGAISANGAPNAVFEWIKNANIDLVITAGICTDICLGNFVLDLLSARTCGLLGPQLKHIAVYEPATASYDLTLETVRQLGLPETAAHPQMLYHAMALRTLQNQGVILTRAIT